MLRLFDRRGLAVLILASWAAVLGCHVRREFSPSEARRLALGVQTLPPGVAYYQVFRGDRLAGWARTEFDTLPGSTGFRIRELLEFQMPGLGSAGPLERSSDEYLGADLNLDSLTRAFVVGHDTTRLVAAVRGDSMVRVQDTSGRVEVIPLDGPVTTSAGWRLRLAADGDARPGDRYAVDLFDPVSAAGLPVDVRVLERRSVAFPDSADTDSLSDEWIAVRMDSVLAWRTRRRAGDLVLDAWVDEDGRLVDGEIEGGLRVRRTAFELAFFRRPWAVDSLSIVDAGDTLRQGEPE
jgi:hypothetical protein